MARPLLATDSSEENLPSEDKNWSIKKHKRGLVKEHAGKLLESMNGSFIGEIGLVEETIAPTNIMAPRPRRRRSRLQKEDTNLAVGLRYKPLSSSATGSTRRGKGFRPQ
ncbi:hypothetical protein AMTRI_Chr01g130440 [Amborella trichopoda]